MITPGIYQHFKGGQYRVLGIARHSETDEDLVLYMPLYGEANTEYFVRPLEVFNEFVTVDGNQVARFVRISD